MPATAGVVRDISAGLLTIHGQHDSTSLTNPATHLALLDQYAQDGAEYAALPCAVPRSCHGKARALDALTSSEEEKQRRIAELSEEIDTIDAAALTAGEEERLMERRKVIMHAQGILDGLTAAHQALSGDDSGEMMGAADLLGSVVNELAESARLDESGTAQRAPERFVLRCAGAGHRPCRPPDGYDFDPGELDQTKNGWTRFTA